MSLREKSDAEIAKLLDEYDIKHGPIVGSTRQLYENKLESAMKNAAVKPSSDKTFYREEEEEITYITYSPVKHEVHGDMLKRRGNVETDGDEGSDRATEAPVQATNRTANHSAAQSREPVKRSGGGMWRVIRLLLLFAALAAAFYYAYCRVINNEENPFGIQYSD